MNVYKTLRKVQRRYHRLRKIRRFLHNRISVSGVINGGGREEQLPPGAADEGAKQPHQKYFTTNEH